MDAVFRSAFGPAGSYILLAFLAVFAFASILSWVFYADGCIGFLVRYEEKGRLVRVPAAVGALCVRRRIPVGRSRMAAADIFNALMIFPNLFMLFIYRKEIKYGVL